MFPRQTVIRAWPRRPRNGRSHCRSYPPPSTSSGKSSPVARPYRNKPGYQSLRRFSRTLRHPPNDRRDTRQDRVRYSLPTTIRREVAEAVARRPPARAGGNSSMRRERPFGGKIALRLAMIAQVGEDLNQIRIFFAELRGRIEKLGCGGGPDLRVIGRCAPSAAESGNAVPLRATSGGRLSPSRPR